MGSPKAAQKPFKAVDILLDRRMIAPRNARADGQYGSDAVETAAAIAAHR